MGSAKPSSCSLAPSIKYSSTDKAAPRRVRVQFTWGPAAHMLHEDATLWVFFVQQDHSYVHCPLSSHAIWEVICLPCYIIHYWGERLQQIWADSLWLSVCVCVCVLGSACVWVWICSVTHSVLLDRWGQRSHWGQWRFYTRKIAT